MAVDGKFTYPGSAGEQISSLLAGEAHEARKVRACSAALAVVYVLEALGYLSNEEQVELVNAEPPGDLLMVSEVILAALQAESIDTHERMLAEATRAMLEVATDVPQ